MTKCDKEKFHNEVRLATKRRAPRRELVLLLIVALVGSVALRAERPRATRSAAHGPSPPNWTQFERREWTADQAFAAPSASRKSLNEAIEHARILKTLPSMGFRL